MDGFNIDAIPSSRKIYYTALEKINPKENSLGSKVQINMYSTSTMDGVLVTENDITSIGQNAFSSCSALTSITIPDGVTSIGNGAFHGCDRLESVYISDISTWCNISFRNYNSNPLFYANNLYLNNELVTDLIIPDGVTSIGKYAFVQCYSLTSVNIPDSVTTIGEEAFYDCDSLTEFKGKFASEDGRCLIIDGILNSFAIGCGATEYTIPDSVTDIGGYAFSSCTSLTSVNIPDSVTTIGEYAFRNCKSLTSVYCKPTTPPKGDYGMFLNLTPGLKIYVPMESVEAYKNALPYWSVYADAIEGYEF